MSETSESLFEGAFTKEQPSASNSNSNSTDVLPSSDTHNEAIIGYRVLVSVKEAGIIIGKEGSVIANIRDTTNTKAAISPMVPSCPDRILTITGSIDSVSQALGLVASALRSSPIDDSAFSGFPLKRLSSQLDGNSDLQTLRLLIPNAQMGTIIGQKGSRIQALQSTYNVKLIASKDFLHNSTERLVELQGTPEQIQTLISVLSKCLLEDWHNGTGTQFYTPTPRQRSQNTHNNNTHSNNHSNSAHDVVKHVKFPSDMIGCLIGKAGTRIQEIRRVTGTQIIIDEADVDGERGFELRGKESGVNRALGYLNFNLEKERERRESLQQ